MSGPAGGRGPVLVIADDLTGGNATAAGLARAGLRAVTVTDAGQPEVVAEFVSRFDAVVVSVNNRHEDPARAADQVRRALRAGWPASVVSNRVDSTLRGNVGATTEALLEELAELSGARTVALCVPAHPGAARQTVGGVQLLGGLRLEETELARDPRSPVRDSRVADLLARQTDLPVLEVPLARVTGPEEDLVGALRDAADGGARIVVVDALTDEHVTRVARAAARVAEDVAGGGDPLRWLCVDPGPATLAAALADDAVRPASSSPYLAVSGSATELTRRQLDRLCAARAVRVVRLALDGSGSPDVDATARALREALASATGPEVVLLASALTGEDLLGGDAGERVPAALAHAARRALEEARIDGLYATGGDVAAACFGELGADGLEVADEVVPLAVGGSLVGGPWSGLPVVTKGGLIGDDETAVACLAFLERAAEAARRHVQPARSRER